MVELRVVDLQSLAPQRLAPLIGAERLHELLGGAAAARATLGGGTIWSVSSTSVGGGVAEMLHVLLGYAKGSGIDARWVVLDGDPAFFSITKRLHNRLHGTAGDAGALDEEAARHYAAVTAANADVLSRLVHQDDIVLLHDPQAAGLAGPLASLGIRVVWRCHIGTDLVNAFTEEGWEFLWPHLRHCRAYVFSHDGFVPPQLAEADVWIIWPSIDPYTAKNRTLSRSAIVQLMTRIGLLGFEGTGSDAGITPGGVSATARIRPDDRMVLQVSRWDRLKDMRGVLESFAEYVAGRPGVVLTLAGPDVESVADDPEQAEVYGECLAAWEALPTSRRQAIRLVRLPMNDMEDNALMVNALQRHAAVVVQKSLAEGFGLTVAEAMWKSRPVIASAVGGIVDQLAPGTGLLLRDPSDLADFGNILHGLLADPVRMAAMGRRARRHVRVGFLGDRHLLAYAKLIEHLSGA